MRKILTMSLLFLSLIFMISPLSAQGLPRQAPWVAESITVVGIGCKDEDAIIKMSEAAKISNEEFAKVGLTVPCRNLPPTPVMLKRKLFEYVDFENDLVEVWQVESFPPYNQVFYTWLLSPSKQTMLYRSVGYHSY